MELGRCPLCGSLRVRTGENLLRHLLRVSHGSRRRYCHGCRFRWTSSVRAFSPLSWLARGMVVSALVLSMLTWLATEIKEAPPLARKSRSEAISGPATETGVTEEEALYEHPALAEARGKGLGRRISLSGRGGPARMTIPGYAGRSQWARTGGGFDRTPAMLQMLLALIRNTGKDPKEIAAEIDSTSKEELWRKYGSHFGSKEEARAAYNKFQRHRKELVR